MTRNNSFNKVTALIAASALTVVMGLPAVAQVGPRPGNNRSPQAPAQQNPSRTLSALDREFMMMAAQGNNAEIQTSQLALQQSRSETVRNYAQRMIQEHTLANQQLTQLATQYQITLPTDPGPLNAAIAQELSQLSGANFDQAYLGVQENAHLRAIALYRTAVLQGRSPEIQRFASGLLPNINNHYQTATNLMDGNGMGNLENNRTPVR